MIDLRHLAGQSIDVLGLRRTGLAAADALRAAGAVVRVWDDAQDARTDAESRGHRLDPEVGGPPARLLLLSPGIPHSFPKPHPAVVRARASQCQIVGDSEMLWQAVPSARYVAVTGTNGKSTTTALIGHVLARAGLEVAVGGNLGMAVLGLPMLDAEGIYVLEQSSYQLELLPTAAFDVGVLLNISPDHLDRHGGMDGYVRTKARVFGGERRGGVAVIGIDDPHCVAIAEAVAHQSERRIIPISTERAVPGGVYATDEMLVDAMDGSAREVVRLSALPRLPGRHNAQNAAAAWAVARSLGVDAATIVREFASFPGLPHRMAPVATIAGVRFVDDSKATNADSAARALACERDVYWIAGGVAKEGGLAGVEPFLDRVRHAFLIGKAAPPFALWLEGWVSIEVSGTLDMAVCAAFARARADLSSGSVRDPVVLLSPACASFDQFKDFEDRGRRFAEIVAALGPISGSAGERA